MGNAYPVAGFPLTRELEMRSLLFPLLLIASTCVGLDECAAETLQDWHPPPEGMVRDGKAAITIAWAVWISSNPGWNIGSEADWQKDMQATLDNGVWEVTERTDSSMIGGGLFIDIAQSDAHIVRIYLTQ
jgi:hypothetical protein